VIQPGKNQSNSAFWCGSPSIVRRTALQEIDGVATETITEDIHTSVRLHSRGWSSFFLNEVLAYGIAPQTIKSFLVQRLRWAQGTMQLYRSSDSPLWIEGLTIQQRLSYLSSFFAYFEAFQKFILIMAPVFIIMFNVFPMSVQIVEFLIRWMPVGEQSWRASILQIYPNREIQHPQDGGLHPGDTDFIEQEKLEFQSDTQVGRCFGL
jgi:cellulose synthase (UDP-forming)